jgi:hypothetical protein
MSLLAVGYVDELLAVRRRRCGVCPAWWSTASTLRPSSQAGRAAPQRHVVGVEIIEQTQLRSSSELNGTVHDSSVRSELPATEHDLTSSNDASDIDSAETHVGTSSTAGFRAIRRRALIVRSDRFQGWPRPSAASGQATRT